MASLDMIEAALNAPIDWTVFEKLVCDVLTYDDIPRLRKCASFKDGGADAFDVAFYQDESQIERIIQITSQRSQTLKVSNTIKRLKDSGLSAKVLVIVFRHPVASTTRTDIQGQCQEAGMIPDIRDQAYLVTQIARPGSTIFARYFDSFTQQLRSLLDAPDPLNATGDRVLCAVLASVAVFVANPRANLARSTLFEKTVLAVLVSLGNATTDAIVTAVKDLVPEDDISRERIVAALGILQGKGECTVKDYQYQPSDNTLAAITSILSQTTRAYNELTTHVLEACRRDEQCDQASLGYVERNLRHAMLRILRSVGPLTTDMEPVVLDDDTTHDIRRCIYKDVNEAVGKRALLAFCSYIEDQTNTPLLALFARSYSSLALRNLDPIGRRWQQTVLSRTIFALDTDTVLGLLIEELPQHKSLQSAIAALIRSGVTIHISPDVLNEVMGHVERALKTMKRFSDTLLRLSPAAVEAEVWHAVVQGYYYAVQAKHSTGWPAYWRKYYDSSKPGEYIRFLLQRKIQYTETSMHDIPNDWLPCMEELSSFLSAKKEAGRQKAKYRDENMQRRRVECDVRMALHLCSDRELTGKGVARGYIATEDSAFLKLEHHAAWPTKHRIVVLTHALPQMAEFICGQLIDDHELVRLLFSPIVAAAAHLLEPEIRTLVALGVDLHNESVERIDWSLRGKLHDAVQDYQQTDSLDERLRKAAGVVGLAGSNGLMVESTLSDLVREFNKSAKEARSIVQGRAAAEYALRKVATAMATSKKAKRRLNRVLRELGLTLADLETDTEFDESQQDATEVRPPNVGNRL